MGARSAVKVTENFFFLLLLLQGTWVAATSRVTSSKKGYKNEGGGRVGRE